MDRIITLSDVAESESGTPSSVALYAYDVQGCGMVMRAIDSLLGGELVKIAVCERDHTRGGPPTLKKIYTLKIVDIDGIPTLRICGENDDPDGPGSCSAIGSYYPKNTDRAWMAAWIAKACARHGEWWFLLRDGFQL